MNVEYLKVTLLKKRKKDEEDDDLDFEPDEEAVGRKKPRKRSRRSANVET